MKAKMQIHMQTDDEKNPEMSKSAIPKCSDKMMASGKRVVKC